MLKEDMERWPMRAREVHDSQQEIVNIAPVRSEGKMVLKWNKEKAMFEVRLAGIDAKAQPFFYIFRSEEEMRHTGSPTEWKYGDATDSQR